MPTLPHLYHTMLSSHQHTSTAHILSTFLHPLLRVSVSSFLIWYLSGKIDQPRFKCAVLFGIAAAFVTYVELSPFLLGGVVVVSSSESGEDDDTSSSSADAPFALVALQILTVTSFLVGMASGSLLPRLFLGVCCGGVLGLLGVALIGWMGLAEHATGGSSSIGGFVVGGNSGLGFFPVVGGGLALIMGGISCR